MKEFKFLTVYCEGDSRLAYVRASDIRMVTPMPHENLTMDIIEGVDELEDTGSAIHVVGYDAPIYDPRPTSEIMNKLNALLATPDGAGGVEDIF